MGRRPPVVSTRIHNHEPGDRPATHGNHLIPLATMSGGLHPAGVCTVATLSAVFPSSIAFALLRLTNALRFTHE
jgi:hypothetical protein